MFLINNTYLVFRFYLLWQPHFYLFSLNFYLFSLFSLLVYLSSFLLTLCFLFCCVLPLFVWVSYFLSDLLLFPTPHPNLPILLFQFPFCYVLFFLHYRPWSGKQGLNLPFCGHCSSWSMYFNTQSLKLIVIFPFCQQYESFNCFH